MKKTRMLIAGLCLFAGAAVQFCLAFSGNSGSRILSGVLFSGAAVVAWREWNGERKYGRTVEERNGSHL